MHKIFAGLLVLVLLPPWTRGVDAGQAQELADCAPLDVTGSPAATLAFPLIAVGRVEANDSGQYRLVPEVYLRGPALPAPLLLVVPQPTPCPLASLPLGERVLVALFPAPGGWRWPADSQAYILRNGQVANARLTVSEAEAIEAIRRVTGQLAYPASTGEADTGFDWQGTALPVGVALLIVFVVGLYLMRLWHRIDPT